MGSILVSVCVCVCVCMYVPGVPEYTMHFEILIIFDLTDTLLIVFID